MLENLKRYIEAEPARFYRIIRQIAIILTTVIAGLTMEQIEPFLLLALLLLGVDHTTTEKTRSLVTPVAKLKPPVTPDNIDTTLPPAERE